MLTLLSAGPGLFYLAMAAAAANHGAQPVQQRSAPAVAGKQVVQVAPNCSRTCRMAPAADVVRAERSDLSAPGE